MVWVNITKQYMKFDGWRFDYVKGFGPWVVKDWNANVGGFSVGEYWDSNVNTWNGGQTMPTALYLTLLVTKMNDAFDGNNLNLLNDDMM
jgi:alpha-amylase